MRAACVLLLIVPVLAAQEISIDLAGAWKVHSGDDAAWASSTFDDTGWGTETLPTTTRFLRQAWLRRWFHLPAGVGTQPLVITIGGLAADYELYLNGVRIAAVTDSFPQARLFEVSAEVMNAGSRNLIAIRVKPAQSSQGAFLPMPNAGPFLVTGRANAPVLAPERDFERRLRRSTPVFGAWLVFAVLALLLIVLWLGEPARVEFLALALMLALDALVRLQEYFRLLYPSFDLLGIWQPLRFALVLAYAIPVLGFRLPWAWWIWGGAFLLTVPMLVTDSDFWVVLYWLVIAGVLAVVALRWRPLRGGRALAFTALVLPAIQILRTPSVFRPFTAARELGGFFVRGNDIAEALLAVAMIILLVRRLISDRQEKNRIASELEAARGVQQLLIPTTNLAGTDAVYLPATEVGGDFWHFYDGRLLVVGDVSGKGLKAAMVVSLITGMLDRRHADSPAALLAELNRTLAKRLDGGFVTCCVVRLSEDGQLMAANAGHPAPYLKGRELELPPGLPLGVVAEAEYEEVTVAFDGPLTLVSDGVIEAANASGELFGFERTREMATNTAAEIAEAARSWGQNDDITVVTVRRVS